MNAPHEIPSRPRTRISMGTITAVLLLAFVIIVSFVLVSIPLSIVSLVLGALVGNSDAWLSALMLGWLCAGPIYLWRPVERWRLQHARAVRPLALDEHQIVWPIYQELLHRGAIAADRFDLYVEESDQINAYATGASSIAITSAAIQAFRDPEQQACIAGILAHELGHHSDYHGRVRNHFLWYQRPLIRAFRVFEWFIIGYHNIVASLCASAGVFGLLVSLPLRAVVQLLVWVNAALLWTYLAVVHSIFRRGEFVADRYAAELGHADALIAALTHIGSDAGSATLRERLYDSHPPTHQRIARLRQIVDLDVSGVSHAA